MLLTDFSDFVKKCQVALPFVCLITGEEREEAEGFFLSQFKGEKVLFFDGKVFSIQSFLDEALAMTFGQKRLLCVRSAGGLGKKEIEAILPALVPSPQLFFLFLAGSIAPDRPLAKFIGEKGIFLRLSPEGVKEKEKRLLRLLVERAAKEGVFFEEGAAEYLVKRVALDPLLLFQEYEKLVSFSEKTIKKAAIEILVSKQDFSPLWNLGECIFLDDFRGAYLVAKEAIGRGEELPPLFAFLRSQLRSSLSLLTLFEQDPEAARRQFPYLKGTLFDKKVKVLRSYGKKRLEEAIVHLFEAEREGRDGNNPLFVVERFLHRVIHAPSSS